MPHWSADDITALTTDDQLVETFTIDGVANIQGKFDGPSTNISLGMGDVASMTPNTAIERLTVGTVITPASGIYMKLSYEYWKPSTFVVFQSGHVGFGGAF